MRARFAITLLVAAVCVAPAWADHDWNPNTVAGAVSEATIVPCSVEQSVSGTTGNPTCDSGGTNCQDEFDYYEWAATTGQDYFFSIDPADGGINENGSGDLWAFDDSLTSGTNNNSGDLGGGGSESITATGNSNNIHLIKIHRDGDVGDYTMVYSAAGVACPAPALPGWGLVLALGLLLLIGVGVLSRQTFVAAA